MTHIHTVEGTAFVVAEFRNEENGEPHPLYHDRFVGLFLDEESKKAAANISRSFPPIRNNVRLRTRYFDDKLDQQLRQGCRQVVILGAGLDTRPQRMAAPGVVFFEIDAPGIQAFKKARLEAGNVDPNTTFIGGDYLTGSIIDRLTCRDFNVALSTFVIWEGNSMYLSDQSVRQVLAALARNVRSCTISFDYLAEAVIEGRTGDPEIADVVQRFAAMGAPWTYGINDPEALGASCGFRVIETATLADLHRAYWPGRELTSPLYDYYAVCTAQNQAAG